MQFRYNKEAKNAGAKPSSALLLFKGRLYYLPKTIDSFNVEIVVLKLR
jgi:hypothetical protein